MSKKSILKKIFSPVNIIIFCFVIMLGALVVFLESSEDEVVIQKDGVQIISSNIEENVEITENEAKKLAIKEFKLLGEKKVSNKNVTISKIRRGEVEFYYAVSAENSLEIKIKRW